MRSIYRRWRHRRMIRKAWPWWYQERGTPGRMMWKFRGEQKLAHFPSVRAAVAAFEDYVAKQAVS